MKIFSWMCGELTGKQEIKKHSSSGVNTNNTRQDSRREEFSDWPYGLLAIGTFGNNNNLKQYSDKSRLGETNTTSDDHIQDISPEEVNELQKGITQLLYKQQYDGLLDTQNPQSGNILEDDDSSDSNKDDRITRLKPSVSVVLNRERDIRADQKKDSIGKKSLSFMFKKIFVCGSGFAPTPSLRDPIPEHQSRMQKILRAILHRKIYPQNSNPKATPKKYLETNQPYNSDSDDDLFAVENDGSKWVKTDSEYIVLEI